MGIEIIVLRICFYGKAHFRFEKIRDLERLLAKERAEVSKNKVNSMMVNEKLQNSESSRQALQSEKDRIEGQLIQLRNEVSSLKGKLSEERSAVKTKEEQINQLTSDLSAEKSLTKFKDQQINDCNEKMLRSQNALTKQLQEANNDKKLKIEPVEVLPAAKQNQNTNETDKVVQKISHVIVGNEVENENGDQDQNTREK